MNGCRVGAQVATLIALGAMAGGCDEANDAVRAVGQLESDRIELIAEATEPVREILVTEGDRVTAGDALVRQDTSRRRAQIAESRAVLSRLEARLAEVRRGPRAEAILAARANVEGAEQEARFRRTELGRARDLFTKKLGSEDAVDSAKAAHDAAVAQLAFYRARLAELDNGATAEELEQAEQAVTEAQARLDALAIELARLTLTAPADGVIDSILFETGETPAIGEVVIVMLAGTQAHARIYVPEIIRVHVRPGTGATVFVDGLERPLAGRVRQIASDASFTPYFALTTHDRGRLSYVAEVDLIDYPERLPDGVPVEVEFSLPHGPAGSDE